MKVQPSEEFLTNIREGIQSTRNRLNELKRERKSLIAEIRETKNNIRMGEKHCSTIQNAKLFDATLNSKLDEAQSHLREHLKQSRDDLMVIRHNLLSLDIHRELELSRFRILHRELDKMNVPFDPNAKQKG